MAAKKPASAGKKKTAAKRGSAPAGRGAGRGKNTAPQRPTAEHVRQKNQVRAVVLFACAILLACLVLIPGDNLWNWAHNAVLGLFGGPSLQVGDRHVLLQAAAETPGPGVAYVRFTASWLDGRPGYMDADTAPESESGVPRMEQYQFDVRVRADVPSSGPLGHLPPEGKAMKGE